jgi:hypothetical protein
LSKRICCTAGQEFNIRNCRLWRNILPLKRKKRRQESCSAFNYGLLGLVLSLALLLFSNLSLARVKVEAKDVNWLASEFSLPTSAAEFALKEAKGDLETALRTLVSAGSVLGAAMDRREVGAISKAAVMKDSHVKSSF